MTALRTDSLSVTIYVITMISLFCNTILFVVYFRCPLKKIKSYKYFFLMTAFEDVIFSATFILLVPLVVSGSDFIIFFNSGIIKDKTVASILLTVFTVCFFTSLLLVTNSFLYRYIQLCRSEIFEKYSTKETVLGGGLINLVIIFNITLAMYIVFWPDDGFVQVVMNTVNIPGLNITGTAFIGFSLKYNLNALDLSLLVNLISIVISMVVLNIFCAKRIISFLKDAASQRNSFLRHQRRMFILLLLQSACPLIFLQVPWLFSVLLLFTGISTTSFITSIISTSIALYPISSPIAIMIFIKDYRNFILASMKLKDPLEQLMNSLFRKNVITVKTIATNSSNTGARISSQAGAS